MHGGANTSGIVGIWLKISFRLAKVLSRIGLSANTLSLLGVIFALGASLASPRAWCIFFLSLSLLSDGVDGSVAILSNRTSKMGSLLDSIADRAAEAFWFLALYRLGVSLPLLFAAWLIASFQEYARARMGSGGVREIGVVTVAERPVRACFIFLAMLSWQFSFSREWINPLTGILTALQLMGFVQVLRFAHSSLK